MLEKRKVWLERIANWGVGLAVPLVAIGGFKLLTHARDGAQPLPGQPAPTMPVRVLAPPIDASAPPVVNLTPAPAMATVATRPASGGDGGSRCAALARESDALDAAARRATGTEAARLRQRGAAAHDEARALHCRPP